MRSIKEAREIIESWRIDYNEVRPHRIGLSTPEYISEDNSIKTDFLGTLKWGGVGSTNTQLNDRRIKVTLISINRNKFWIIFALLILMIQTECISQTSLGLGGSMVTDSAADTIEISQAKADSESTDAASTSQGEAKELTKCIKPIATVALIEDDVARQRYSYVLTQSELPPSPLPLLLIMLQQSNCFQVVDRNRDLQGMLKEDSNMAKGQMVGADYTITPNIIFSVGDAERGASAADALLPRIAGVLGGLKISKKEVQVALFLVDSRSGVQVAASKGSAKISDVGFAELEITRMLASGGGAWAKTDQGKVIAAAFLDATTKMIDIIRDM